MRTKVVDIELLKKYNKKEIMALLGFNEAQLKAAEQKKWLYGLYQKLVKLGNAEITAHSFEGASHSAQFRGATPEDYRLALMSAIETLEGLIAGNVAHSASIAAAASPPDRRSASARTPARTFSSLVVSAV